ncbi:MAG: Helix-hairpin-helix domain [Verrucomicrobiota bacterium]
MSVPLNHDIAGRLDEVGQLLAEQGANPFRVRAYHHAATVLRTLERPLPGVRVRGGPRR